tara:strand:- start:8 stop:205 length:198 start_codon:yes stop_codon:yes gene_type:complete
VSAKYKPVAAAMWPDVMDWLVKEHANDIIKLYEKLFSAYLSKTYGNLTPEVRKALIKELMTNIIY